VRAVALEQVHSVSARVAIPTIGMGGIASGRHAADFLVAGATCVAVGTESFRDPAAGRRIASELTDLRPSIVTEPTRPDTSPRPSGGQAAAFSP
jgi:dihydroorotate dehydrogenase (NAD+) catalytic subunit